MEFTSFAILTEKICCFGLFKGGFLFFSMRNKDWCHESNADVMKADAYIYKIGFCPCGASWYVRNVMSWNKNQLIQGEKQ